MRGARCGAPARSRRPCRRRRSTPGPPMVWRNSRQRTMPRERVPHPARSGCGFRLDARDLVVFDPHRHGRVSSRWIRLSAPRSCSGRSTTLGIGPRPVEDLVPGGSPARSLRLVCLPSRPRLRLCTGSPRTNRAASGRARRRSARAAAGPCGETTSAPRHSAPPTCSGVCNGSGGASVTRQAKPCHPSAGADVSRIRRNHTYDSWAPGDLNPEPAD